MMKQMPKWMRSLTSNDSFDSYYGRLINKGGAGLPSAAEAKRDFDQARRLIDARFPL